MNQNNHEQDALSTVHRVSKGISKGCFSSVIAIVLGTFGISILILLGVFLWGILFGGEEEKTQDNPQQVQEEELDLTDHTNLSKEASALLPKHDEADFLALYKELLELRYNPFFHNLEYARTEKGHQWKLKCTKMVKDKNFTLATDIPVGMLPFVASDWSKSEGGETEYTSNFFDELSKSSLSKKPALLKSPNLMEILEWWQAFLDVKDAVDQMEYVDQVSAKYGKPDILESSMMPEGYSLIYYPKDDFTLGYRDEDEQVLFVLPSKQILKPKW